MLADLKYSSITNNVVYKHDYYGEFAQIGDARLTMLTTRKRGVLVNVILVSS